ncbi:MAG: copper resistance protein [Caulobacteraceae bacterium]|nr:copper resistance protein [Caulobacteraceae bacterium]
MSLKSALVLAAAVSLVAGAALAHPHVVSATPAQDSQVTGSPKVVRIKFNEAPTAAFSAIALKDAAGKPVKTGKVGVDKADKTVLTAPIAQTLAPGVYKVTWRAAGSDTHKVDGTYSFTVK